MKDNIIPRGHRAHRQGVVDCIEIATRTRTQPGRQRPVLVGNPNAATGVRAV
jgi:hypothetical protein